MNFIELVDIIFKNKGKYGTVSKEDKENNFYIINKKFSLGSDSQRGKYLKFSQFFNHKAIDKASALDLWFLFFKKTPSIPGWYWIKNTNTKEKKNKIPNADRELLLKYNDITERDLDFMIEHYKDDVDMEIKKIKRFKND